MLNIGEKTMKLDKKIIVVKVGTSTITNDDGSTNLRAIDRLARTLSEVESMGYKVVLVSSGAIAVGANKMRLIERPKETRLKQAVASVGQCELIHLYDRFFMEYGRTVGQILFTSEDLDNEEKRKNLAQTLEALLENNIIPIINENDSISHAEIMSKDRIFGDNDMLSAIVAKFVGAAKLIILSDIHGLYDSDPRTNPKATIIDRVDDINKIAPETAGGAGSKRGTGGMKSKISAAKFATEIGIDVLIIYGREPETIFDIIDGKKAGTLIKGRKIQL